MELTVLELAPYDPELDEKELELDSAGGGDPRWMETGARAEPLLEACIPPYEGAAVPTVAYTDVLAVPFWMACSENLFNAPKSPRGMPSPAESLRKTKEFLDDISERTTGLERTGTMVGCPRRGGWGGATGVGDWPVPLLPLGLNAIIVPLFRPAHEPPGCHPQPAPLQ